MSEAEDPVTVASVLAQLAPLATAFDELVQWVKEPTWALEMLWHADQRTDVPVNYPREAFAEFRTRLVQLVDEGAFRDPDPAVRPELLRRSACHAWIKITPTHQQEIFAFAKISAPTGAALEALSASAARETIAAFLGLSDAGRALSVDVRAPVGETFAPVLGTAAQEFDARCRRMLLRWSSLRVGRRS